MDSKLFIQAIVKYLVGLLLFSALLFIPAGTVNYWNGWLLMGILFVPILLVGIFLAIKNPVLLRKRLNSKEEQSEQKSVLIVGSLMFLSGFIVAGLDFRYQWLAIDPWVVGVATIVFIMGYLIYVEVLRENTYLSRTIEIQENQQVVSTGLYGIVRHPMYTATLLLFLSMPLVLGSFFSFLIFLIYPVLIAKRIRNEEIVLERSLEGYSKYKEQVKYRLIPFIW
ncbi:MAG: isoprenylcysteine carboxylmethyltransferase family protein [Erysipelothrix sp.]|nr:isoprenylcysteine carboxylmethyltransferase family protein [Erysipelothrix sp.]